MPVRYALPAILDLTQEQVNNLLHQIGDDVYVRFLIRAYG
jgi:hypothetical protein